MSHPNHSLGFFFTLALVLSGSGCQLSRNQGSGVGNTLKPHYGATELATATVANESGALVSAPKSLPAIATDGQSLILKKTDLDKEFLLSVSLIPQLEAPTSSALKAKVVRFAKRGSKIFLTESPAGNVTTTDLPSSIILAGIPVKEERADEWVLDFGSGMTQVFVTGGWYASDFDGPNFDGASQGASFKLVLTSVESIKEVSPGVLEIRQAAQSEERFGLLRNSYEIRYFLQAYNPSPTYKPQESDRQFNRVGFFESSPILELNSGRSLIYRTLWDISRPVKYCVSANTPAEYLDAVKKGILYWNKAFGREVIQVEIAPVGATAPSATCNIVQWVPNDAAGVAYADAIVDPRTGETLHAQVFMTSVFAVSSKYRARQILRRLQSAKGPTKRAKLDVKSWESSQLCEYNSSERFIGFLEKGLDTNLTDADWLRISRDYVTEVVAHEVGHTLGMRHNFAGNLGSNVDLEERDSIFEAYVKEGKVPKIEEKHSTSSVMEYNTFEDGILVGAQMAMSQKALEYDQVYIDHAYKGAPVPKNSPLFCTDTLVGSAKHLDCFMFDHGRSSIEGRAYQLKTALDRLPISFVETFLYAKSAPAKVDQIPLEQVRFDAGTSVSGIAANFGLLLKWMDSSMLSVRTLREFDAESTLTDIETEGGLQFQLKYVEKEAARIGGPVAAFFGLFETEGLDPAVDRTKETKDGRLYLPNEKLQDYWKKTLAEYLTRPSVRKFAGADGLDHELTDAEVELIQKRSEGFFKKAQERLVELALKAIGKSKFDLEMIARKGLSDNGISTKIEARLGSLAKKVILDVSETDEQVTFRTAKINIPKFRFPTSTRVAAAGIMAARIGADVDWLKESRKSVLEGLQKLAADSLNEKSYSDIAKNILPANRKLRTWLSDQELLFPLLLN